MEAHPTAIAIKKELIDNPLFTFKEVSILDYPWVSECGFRPTPHTKYSFNYLYVPRSDEGRTYFAHRDYHIIVNDEGELVSKIPYDSEYCNKIGYVHSHSIIWQLDGSTNYKFHSSLKLVLEIKSDLEKLSHVDVETLKIQTKDLIFKSGSVFESDITTVTVDKPYNQELTRFKESDYTYTLSRNCKQFGTSNPDPNITHIEVVFTPQFSKTVNLCKFLDKTYVYDISSGPLVGHISFDYQPNCKISCLNDDNETGTDYARKYLEYTKNSCIWGLLDCDCSSSGCECLKVQNEGPNRDWYGHGIEGKIGSLGTVSKETLKYRINTLNSE